MSSEQVFNWIEYQKTCSEFSELILLLFSKRVAIILRGFLSMIWFESVLPLLIYNQSVIQLSLEDRHRRDQNQCPSYRGVRYTESKQNSERKIKI